eukprot:gene60481-80662_t
MSAVFRQPPCTGLQPAFKITGGATALPAAMPSPPGPAAPLPARICFGRFELRPREGRLLEGGEPVPLGGRAFDLLIALVERAGELVGRNELIERVWPGRIVEENNLSVQVNALRKAIGGEWLKTVP